MAMLGISKHLFRRFYSCSLRRVIISNQNKNSYLMTHFESRFHSKVICNQRYYSSNEKWITIILEKIDGTRIKRKGKTGATIHDILYGDADFPEFGECKGTESCTTCHVIFTKEDFSIVSKYNNETEKELDLLDDIENRFASSQAQHRTDTSRLGCCIELVPEMDGMVIKLPKTKALTDDP